MIDGIINEPTINFVGKDGFFWWVGEVEDNEDPMELGRCKVRVLGYYTNVRGGTTADLPTKELPWATVLQHTSQAGNDGQGESSGQLQPGAIVMGFFMDGEDAQMPVVIGVLRVNKSPGSGEKNVFAFTGEEMEPGSQGNVNPVLYNPANPVYSAKAGGNKKRATPNNSVPIPGNKTTSPVNGTGAPGTNVGAKLNGSSGNPNKPHQPAKPIPAANGVAGPWKTLEYKLSYLVEDIANHAGTLVKAENGDFLDIVEGKLVSAKALTAKIQNFLGGVFTAVIAAIRQQIADLAEQLELASLLGGVAGAPYVVMTAVQSAITTLLGALCNVDSQLISMIQDPIGTLMGFVNSFVDGLIDQASMVVQGVQSLIDGIVCNVQGLLSQMLQVVDVVKGIVDGVGAAKDVIDAWQSAGGMFSGGADGFAKGLTTITGIMALILKFVQGDCGRTPTDGADTVGWFPLYGVTHCTEEELEKINKIMGMNKAQPSCGDPFGTGSMIDDIYNTADPFLTQAKTFLDGAYELHVGTPGRRATVTKRASGTTHLSVSANNAEKQEHEARLQMKRENPDATEEEIEKKVTEAKKNATGGSENEGNLVGDDINYGGNLTQVVNGDDCKVVKNDNCITIDGDYRLKVSGNCHIEVGGGFFLAAEGAPRTLDKNGEDTGQDKVQKHQLRFGSDVDLGVNGAKLQVSAAEMDTDIKKTIIQGGSLETKHNNTSISAGSVNISGENDITNTTNHMFNNCGLIPSLAQLGKSGITNTVGGDILNVMTPTLTNPAPTYLIQNTTGQWVGNFLTGYALNIATGGYSCKVGAGAWDTSVGAAATLNAGAAVAITAGATCKITAVTIFLN